MSKEMVLTFIKISMTPPKFVFIPTNNEVFHIMEKVKELNKI